MSELEYGPGIAVPYFKDQEDTLEADIKVIKTAISGMKLSLIHIYSSIGFICLHQI